MSWSSHDSSSGTPLPFPEPLAAAGRSHYSNRAYALAPRAVPMHYTIPSTRPRGKPPDFRPWLNPGRATAIVGLRVGPWAELNTVGCDEGSERSGP
jgi:hypothetical protein